MATARNPTVLRTIPLLIAACHCERSAAIKTRFFVAPAVCLLTLVAFPAQAKYGGGSGTAEDPYQIATAENLIALGETPEDYDKHFILTDDIDLDPNLPEGKVFDKAVIAPDTDANDAWARFQGTAFTGVFDGNGHTISHLTIVGKDFVGLFGQMEGRADVKNLEVVHVSITGSGNYVGGLVGRNDGAVTGCYSTGTISGEYDVGGLVGYNGGGVTHSYSTGAVSGTSSVGALVGYNGSNATMTNCYSAGVVSGGSPVGGLLGNNSGDVTQCYSTGVVSGTGSVGGLVGINNHGAVTHCYSTGAVSGTGNVGGLVGYNYHSGDVTYCFWDVQTSGQTTSAGGTGKTTVEMQTASTFLDAGWYTCGEVAVWTIHEDRDYPRLWWENKPGKAIGYAVRLRDFLAGTGSKDDPYLIYTAEDLNLIVLGGCDWDKHFNLMADINLSGFDGKDSRPAFRPIGTYGNGFVGVFDGNGHTISHLTINGESDLGLFGRLESGAQVMDLRIVDVNITGSGDYVGGLVGRLESGAQVTDLRIVDVNITGSGDYIGGLAGYNAGDVTRCYSTATVSGKSGVGGLVGRNWDGAVTRCYSTGNVSGTGYWPKAPGFGSGVGGLVGDNYGGHVTQCYSTSGVNGLRCVGGLVGFNTGDVTHCYSTGAVSGTGNVGGLAGYNSYGTVTACFWNTQTSGQATSSGGTGKTTAEMQTASTYLDAGWDFVNVWGIGENQTYPYLRKYSAADINQNASVDFLDLAVLAENWLTAMGP